MALKGEKAIYVKDRLFCSDFCHECWKLEEIPTEEWKIKKVWKGLYKEVYGDGNDKYNIDLE